MMDYKSYFEKFVEDFYKRFDEDEERRKAFLEITDNYKRTQEKLSEITKALNKPEKNKPIDIIDNPKFIELMGISQKTAQTWRDTVQRHHVAAGSGLGGGLVPVGQGGGFEGGGVGAHGYKGNHGSGSP